MLRHKFIIFFAAATISGFFSNVVNSAGVTVKPGEEAWTTNGVFGSFDRKQLKRGWQVYNEVCAGCHSIRLIYYRNLAEMGFSPNEIKKIAGSVEVPAGPNEDGETHKDDEPIMRPGKAFDRVVSPYANKIAARVANGGALPPDLSLMTKARINGANYVHALLTGFKEAPSGFKLSDGMHYNPYYPGGQIAMAAPLSAEAVEYSDGTKATVEQMSKDVTAFLIWTAEPELEERKRLGIKVIFFLIIFTAMLFAVKRQIWSRLK